MFIDYVHGLPPDLARRWGYGCPVCGFPAPYYMDLVVFSAHRRVHPDCVAHRRIVITGPRRARQRAAA